MPPLIIIQPVSSNIVRESTTNHPGHPGYPAPVGQSAQQARVYHRFWTFSHITSSIVIATGVGISKINAMMSSRGLVSQIRMFDAEGWSRG